MTAPRRLLTAAEVADLLQLSADRFYRLRRQLERLDGFPKPVAARSGRTRLYYDPAAIARWQDAQAGIAPPTGAAHNSLAPANDPEPDYAAAAAANARRLAHRH